MPPPTRRCCRASPARRCASSGRARTSSAGTRKARRRCTRSRRASTPTGASPPGAPRCGCRKRRPIFRTFRCSDSRPPASRNRRASRRGSSARTAIRSWPCRIRKSIVHWLATSPLRPSNIRAPGKIGNLSPSRASPTSSRTRRGAIPSNFGWRASPTRAASRSCAAPPRCSAGSRVRHRGRAAWGAAFAYVHYKNNESYVAIAIEAEVERSSGTIRVRRVACAHDCGLVINPDALRAQIEGHILQTLSRTLFEEVQFDRAKVTSVNWASYPILAFPDVPEIRIDLVSRPMIRRSAPAKPRRRRCPPRSATPSSTPRASPSHGAVHARARPRRIRLTRASRRRISHRNSAARR